MGRVRQGPGFTGVALPITRSRGRDPCAAVGAVPRPQSVACETEALADVVMPDVSGWQLADLPRENDVLDPGTTF